MNKIRAAVVGAGIYGKHHMNAYRHNPDTVLVAICDTDTERCDDLAMAYGIQGYTRLDRLLQQEAIDIVSVATPDPYHTESILTALRHGQHVLAEKPLATSVRECELIVEMAQQR
ncbi:Gfo/Idh/MocA family oxidoreductase, partial [Salmonella enterica subsp. enterica serovar 4,[5],12:i:-]|nr:gfo/Idh/MocA family oxidoreductase [Salmonella enterica subsp. enterica]EAA1597116.1 gfo/Idh/MocA family oxidoreductase [Salmonella enterica subsp. enterica serovar Typhimurium]EAZ7472080.1 Gfo/Idh/MocA family oxidoreductase [Salmonella enterica]EBH9730890.1 Gfo/Idh/MocA family oxidoreductase [Salmonella enterica subsp. enterica serovar 4,[5],12:i:-]HCM3130408.1 Gfo/Idh/MocA family oxidoreductase [Salmonella enterica subsp. enterica serovar Typhimurium var. monophasic 4,[5],12:i:-]HCS979806